MKIYEYTGKKLSDLKEKALNELEKNEKELYFFQEEEETGIFNGKKIKLKVVTQDDVIEYCKEFITTIVEKAGLSAEIEVEIKEEEGIRLNIMSDNNAVLIGKDGRTIDSFQTILNNVIKNKVGQSIKLIVDINGYKDKKRSNFEFNIRRRAQNVKRTGREEKLYPMNSYERRIVHNVCNQLGGLLSESLGEEPYRYIIIKREK